LFYSQGDFTEAEKKMIVHPNLFEHAWNHQVLLADLQGEINEAIENVQKAVSSVLKGSTSETLDQYESHVISVLAEFAPMAEALKALPSSQCTETAHTILNSTVSMTGFQASVCASKYDVQVEALIQTANNELSEFEGIYNQVMSIVVKSFIRQNTFVTGEEIEETITEIFELVGGRWENSKPEIDLVKRNLETSIAEQNRILGNCHTNGLNFAKSAFTLFNSNVQTCLDFHEIQNPLGRSARGMRNYLAEFEQLVANHEEFVWES
jgi:hypothetical protein